MSIPHPLLSLLQRGMSISSISSDDMEFLDFETNQKSGDGASPKGQRARSPFSMVESPSTASGLASPTSDSSPRNVGEHKDPVIPSIAVDSFLPLLKTLPALVLDQSTYYLRGAISKFDLQNLSAYARTIGEFTLNRIHTGDEPEDRCIAPVTFMRLAQLKLHDAPGPLLSSLRKLRVIDPNEPCISQLPLFFTKSLRSLEATGVPEDQQSAFLSFLVTLVDEAPLLSAITLGPGSFTAPCLNACLDFNHLSHLELLDAASSIDFDFLVAIGRLPELETFILNARIATYISPPPTKWDVPSTPVPELQPTLFDFAGFNGPPNEDVHWPPSPGPQFYECPNPPSPYPTDSLFEPSVCFPAPSPIPSPVPRTPSPGPVLKRQPWESIDSRSRSGSPDPAAFSGHFSRLKRLDIVGTLPLINDLYEHVVSLDLERLGLTLVRKSTPTYLVQAATTTAGKKGKKKCTPTTAVVLEPSPTGDIDSETSSFCSLVKSAVQGKWSLTLKGVRLGHLQDYRKVFNGGWGSTTSDPDPVALPSATFEMLLRHKALEDLEITGWTLPSNPARKPPFDALFDATLPNLKVIHLPVGGSTPGIQLDQLLLIINAFPKLVSLQCGFSEQSFTTPPVPVADIPLHGLKVLSVGHHPDSAIDQQQRLRIASFLDVLFPNLERIETHAEYHPEDWAYIHELVKMCQASRLNHANRFRTPDVFIEAR